MPWKKILLEGDASSLTSNAPANVDHAAAAVGVGTAAARDDHKHDLNKGVVGTLKPVDGAAAALGTDNAVPHLDHIHAHGPLVANLNVNQKELVGVILHKSATAPNPATEVEGQLYYNTTVGDKHLYIFTT